MSTLYWCSRCSSDTENWKCDRSDVSHFSVRTLTTDVLKWVLDFAGCVCTCCSSWVKAERMIADWREGGGGGGGGSQQWIRKGSDPKLWDNYSYDINKSPFLTLYCCLGVWKITSAISSFWICRFMSVFNCLITIFFKVLCMHFMQMALATLKISKPKKRVIILEVIFTHNLRA